MSSAPIAETPISLTQLDPQRWATITEVETPKSDLLRLMGLGICVGRKLQLVKTGDPMILRVYGTRVGLSRRLARMVRVMTHPEENQY